MVGWIRPLPFISCLRWLSTSFTHQDNGGERHFFHRFLRSALVIRSLGYWSLWIMVCCMSWFIAYMPWQLHASHGANTVPRAEVWLRRLSVTKYRGELARADCEYVQNPTDVKTSVTVAVVYLTVLCKERTWTNMTCCSIGMQHMTIKVAVMLVIWFKLPYKPRVGWHWLAE